MDSRANIDTNGETNYMIYKLFARTWRKKNQVQNFVAEKPLNMQNIAKIQLKS